MSYRIAGIDVHKRSVTAHARTFEGRKVHRETREFGTFTKELLDMRDWLSSLAAPHAAG